jgi:hypothetical protein
VSMCDKDMAQTRFRLGKKLGEVANELLVHTSVIACLDKHAFGTRAQNEAVCAAKSGACWVVGGDVRNPGSELLPLNFLNLIHQ